MAETLPRYREYRIRPELAPLVKCIWSVESDRPVSDAPAQRILPDSCVELVFHFNDPFRGRFSNREAAVQPRSFVVGQMKHFLEIQPAGRIGFVAVRFCARGAFRFLPQPLSASADEVVDLRHLWREEADEWTERAALAPTLPERVRIIERMLLDSLRQNGRDDAAVDRALVLIEANKGRLSVQQLAAAIGLSERQLRRRFENAVGVSPKEFSRVKRFLCAVRHLKNRPEQNLTDVALECGYFDQAHFNHDFREFAGISPGEFLTRSDIVC